jgi:hypothetical protein
MNGHKIKVVGILQNAWSPYWSKVGHWPRNFWLTALQQSRTGQRLKLFECPELEIWYDESTPDVAPDPVTVLPANLNHMRGVLRLQQPDIIVTFGVPAKEAMKKILPEFKQPVIYLPHPTYRFADDNVFIDAKNYLIGRPSGYREYKVLKDRSFVFIDSSK